MLKNFKETPTLIDHDVFKFKLNTNWKFYDNYFINCSARKLYLLKIDFSNVSLAKYFLNYLNSHYAAENLDKAMSGTYGLTFKLNNKICLIMMDKNHMNNIGKIQHEFMHFGPIHNK